MSLFKNINFTESRYLQLRLESFNTLNHVQPAGVNNAFGAKSAAGDPTTFTSNSGEINAYRNPSNVQLGVKLYF